MDVYEKVKAIVIDQLGVGEDEITPTTTFQALNADSLDIVELVMALEEEFNLDIADEEVENIQSIADVVKYVQENQ
ncbi:MAG: acyl carrier protein [Dehalobacter sp. 4CP]|jgi:acyl carrier protein|uniref:Acyl carrier protein n=2 Tax=Dehalobacter restrictus TaxID=55583 RepID=A0A857DHF6_9FIRM|nr:MULTISPECIES: acyl carrier protein [Dehalobacter]NBJ15655.1 acyl carrier protein [Dehalobacter sp. 4CP]AFV03175.1 Acyl carrier protein [Dehalobacter sp. DCA]AFV06164.1 Acyl carrier protein [Dehalobacter sp. CF]AHF09558.1 acyl carrier protein [Dehalobacter restrictus DSM 9455]EQB21153.1 Acyl carrier protein [Dehalobacter sp. UNSWDHB]